MEKLETIALTRLRNNEHFQFMTDVDQLITTFQPSELAIETLYPAFKSALTSQDAAMRVEIGSIKSKSIEELDKLRDKTWNAISLRIKATQLSPLDNEAESAEVIRRIIDLYGDIRTKSYNEESAGISNLVADLQKPENTDHINRVGIQRWVMELKKQNDDFQSVFNERNSELASRESGDVRAIRLQIDPLYEKIAERINATIVMELAKPAAFSFINELNEKIAYYKTTLVARVARKKEDITEIEK
jgi:hypothetical protein